MKTSFIATVLNEEENIVDLLTSIFTQTKLPDEVIIVDGGSRDKTISKILSFKNIKLIRKKGNRSVGRNEAIKSSRGDIILISDAGCILDKNWVENITSPFNDKEVDVVAGYYSTKSDSVFEKCLTPYVLVMPDKINEKNFLPASRSMALRKKVWKKAGGFPKKYSHNEDYVFAKRLKEENFNIVFRKNAKVFWKPRKNLIEASKMFFRFALGDAQAKILRPKVVLLFLRYVLGVALVVLLLLSNSIFILNLICLILTLYILWAILKNYKYVKKWQAYFILPMIQLTADLSVISGTIWGTLKKP